MDMSLGRFAGPFDVLFDMVRSAIEFCVPRPAVLIKRKSHRQTAAGPVSAGVDNGAVEHGMTIGGSAMMNGSAALEISHPRLRDNPPCPFAPLTPQ
jgi:hypothetical protein